MAGIGDFFAQAVLNLWRNTAYAQPATIYAGLFPSDPGADGSGSTEISGNAYARVAVPWGAPAKVSNVWTIQNSAATFPEATPSQWGTVAYVGFFDALSAGHFLGSLQLSVTKIVGAGDTFQLPANNLSVTVS